MFASNVRSRAQPLLTQTNGAQQADPIATRGSTRASGLHVQVAFRELSLPPSGKCTGAGPKEEHGHSPPVKWCDATQRHGVAVS